MNLSNIEEIEIKSQKNFFGTIFSNHQVRLNFMQHLGIQRLLNKRSFYLSYNLRMLNTYYGLFTSLAEN